MRPNADTDFPLNPSLPLGEHVAIHAAIEAARNAEAYEATLERMARDIEAVIARQESVDSDDLATLGWTVTQIAEIAPEALEMVRNRALRHLS